MDMVDPILTTLVTQLLSLTDERASYLRNGTNEQNLYLNDINVRIEQTKRTFRKLLTIILIP